MDAKPSFGIFQIPASISLASVSKRVPLFQPCCVSSGVQLPIQELVLYGGPWHAVANSSTDSQ